MGDHALLSASGAHKWLTCTPSARLEESFPESTSEYAEEGRLAHEIAELKLRKAFIEPMGARKFNSMLKKLQEKPLYQAEMLGHTDAYLDYISGIVHGYALTPYVAIEKKLNYSEFVPEGFGTGDCIIISGNTLRITDFKYGKGVPVSAENNPQMKLYALGAFIDYSFLYPIEKVIMSIIQPRLSDSPSEYEMTAQDLLEWGAQIQPIAAAAFAGDGEYVSGEHCRFCRAKSLCRARSEFNTSLEEFNQMKPPLISNEEVGQILVRAQQLAAWVKDLGDYALAECLAGRLVQGWKAVEGKSNRQFIDTDQAFKAVIADGYDEALLYERKPITLTAAETLLGKAKFAELLAGHITKPPGKPALVVETDKREAIRPISPEQAFGVPQINENGGL